MNFGVFLQVHLLIVWKFERYACRYFWHRVQSSISENSNLNFQALQIGLLTFLICLGDLVLNVPCCNC